MKATLKLLILSPLLIASTVSFAEPTLTAQQCSDYSFVHTQAPATHKQVMNELYELEAAGYDASSPNAPYPGDLDHAENGLVLNTTGTVRRKKLQPRPAPSSSNESFNALKRESLTNER